jgi:hypothetical protein
MHRVTGCGFLACRHGGSIAWPHRAVKAEAAQRRDEGAALTAMVRAERHSSAVVSSASMRSAMNDSWRFHGEAEIIYA